MRQEALKIFGLKRFLIDFGRMYEKKTIEVSLWNYYLICAELFGIADKVKKELKNFYPELNIPTSINVSLIDTFVSVGYESMYKAKISEKISYSSSNSGRDRYHDYSGNDSYSGGGGNSFSSGGSSGGGSSGGGFR